MVAVLTAAGSGRRLGRAQPKAMVAVGGVTLLRRAAQGLVDSGVVDCIVVTAPPADVSRFRAELAGLAGCDSAAQPAGAAESSAPSYGPGGVAAGAGVGIEVVAGSEASRQASVLLGLEAALASVPGARVVLVHDAARALTPPEVTRRVVAAVRAGYGAVVPALPVTDTVREVAACEASVSGGAAPPAALVTRPGPAVPDDLERGSVGTARPAGSEGVVGAGRRLVGPGTGGQGEWEPGARVEPVVATPERSRLRAVQTPQGFATATLVAAHQAGAGRAGDESVAASDDAGLVEAQGGAVVVVAGHERALKITTPLDLALAELLLGQGEGHRHRP